MSLTLQRILNKEDPDKPGLPFEFDLASDDISLGIEIELENLSSHWRATSSLPSWSGVADGSLRGNSIEVRSKGPVKGLKLKNDLNDLFLAFGTSEGLAQHANVRTSMHVHLNMLDCTAEMLMGTLVVGALMDDHIFNQTHENRRFTGYSMPSENVLVDMFSCMQYNKIEGVRESNLYMGNDFELSRYHSINTQALTKHGTIEFRHFATPQTKKEIVDLINIVMTVKILGVKLAAALNDDFSDTALVYTTAKTLIDEVYEIPEYNLTKEAFIQYYTTMQHVVTTNDRGLAETDTLEGDWGAPAVDDTAVEGNPVEEYVGEEVAGIYRTPSARPVWHNDTFTQWYTGLSPGIADTSPQVNANQPIGHFQDIANSTLTCPTADEVALVGRISGYLGLHPMYSTRITGPTITRDGTEIFRGITMAPGDRVGPLPRILGDELNPSRANYPPCAVIGLSVNSQVFAIYNPTGQNVTPETVNDYWTLVNIGGLR